MTDEDEVRRLIESATPPPHWQGLPIKAIVWDWDGRPWAILLDNQTGRWYRARLEPPEEDQARAAHEALSDPAVAQTEGFWGSIDANNIDVIVNPTATRE